MTYIKQIMKLLKCDTDTAFDVYNEMQVDFSECSKKEFEKEARFVYGRLTKS